MTFDGLAYKLFETQLLFASWASYLLKQAIQIDKCSTFWAEIRLIVIAVIAMICNC
jgi:hypothetical protein